MDLDIIRRVEVINHIGSGFFVAVVKDIILRIHFPLDLMDFVSPVWAIFGHDDGSFKFSVHKIMVIPLEPILD